MNDSPVDCQNASVTEPQRDRRALQIQLLGCAGIIRRVEDVAPYKHDFSVVQISRRVVDVAPYNVDF